MISALETAELRVVADIEEADPDGVLTWRYTSLRRAGHAPDDAARIARANAVDLHLAVERLEHGCKPALALRILI